MSVLFARVPAAAARTVPFWQSTFDYGGKTYFVRLVGTDPSKGFVTTSVANTIVPMRLIFADNTVLDAQTDVAPLLASPIYSNSNFQSGNTQFADSVLRGELWQSVRNSAYHVLLGAPLISPPYVLNVPANYGTVTRNRHGGMIGTVDFSWFVSTVQPAVIAQLGVAPTALTVFLTHDVQLKRGTGRACCLHGNHTSFDVVVPGGRNRFTTVWAGAAAGTVVTMSHEIAEWANDPFNDNVVPQWERPGVDDCNYHLEVGDPLTGTVFRAGGYSLQDVAYAQWFSRQAPSRAIDGRYDLIGSLTTVSSDCTLH